MNRLFLGSNRRLANGLWSMRLSQRIPANAMGNQSRQMATDTKKSGGLLYDVAFKTNTRYLLFVITGAAVGEAVYGFLGDTVWRMNNRGKLYEDVDWSKWESLWLNKDEDEDEGEEEDEADE